jgi:hypothetical protein
MVIFSSQYTQQQYTEAAALPSVIKLSTNKRTDIAIQNRIKK